jgi:hypothetical protein
MWFDSGRLKSVLYDVKYPRRVTRGETQVRHGIPLLYSFSMLNRTLRLLRKVHSTLAKGQPPPQSVGSLWRSRNLHCSILLLVGGSPKFVGRIAVVF